MYFSNFICTFAAKYTKIPQKISDMTIRHRYFFATVAVFFFCLLCSAAPRMTSPNGRVAIEPKGEGFVITCGQQPVLEVPALGYDGMQQKLSKFKSAGQVSADYTMVSGKRLHCVNKGKEYRGFIGKDVTLVVRIYDDGVAFRYEWPSGKNVPLTKEKTTYRIAEGTKRWMQQWADSYEGFFPLTTTAKVKAQKSYSAVTKDAEGRNLRWGYPALMEPADGVFALITEANIERGQSASCLYNDGEMFKVVPDQTFDESQAQHSPWRVIIVGSLADVVESTLVTDVSEPCRLDDTAWIHPGVVSWVYWAYNHGSNDYNIIKKYVDMAAALHLPYVLIDAEWDTMLDGKTIEDAVKYSLEKGIKPMIWYNSSVGWIDGAPTPKFRLNKPEDREREFAWCERIGVAGVKIDFFSGDNQKNMDFCLDLLESAARHHLLVNFHGATVPRGWQRTYPNLLSTEGVYGAEWYNNVATFTKQAASHNATLPFTRNVVGPMDYTPCAFSNSQHPHITTNAHELALTVLFESGLQHLADRPESFLAQPEEVKQFLGKLPAAWDETKLIAGYPGQNVVLARRSGNTWYVAGINGTDEATTLNLPNITSSLSLQPSSPITVFADKGEQDWSISTMKELPESVTLLPRGGFLWVIE